MFDEQKKIVLSDLIDVKFLQKLQDKFAKTMGVACVMLDSNGAITKPSDFSEFCLKHAKSEPTGLSICDGCDIAWESLLEKKTNPKIFSCPMGLTTFTIPIIVKGKNLALIFGGQIFTQNPDENFFRDIAKKEGINEEQYLKIVRKIKILPSETIKAAVDLLFLVSNSISEIAHRNYELIDKNKREELTGKIIAKIRSTLDSEEIKQYFMQVTSEYFDTDRCLFVDFDRSKEIFLPFRLEILRSSDIKSLVGVNPETEFPEFCKKLKKGQNIIIRDLEKILHRNKLVEYKAIKTLHESYAKSDYGLLVSCRDHLVGILIIHFIREKKILTQNEFDFLAAITKQAGTALCQAELYSTVKQQAQREALLRRVVEITRDTLDIDKAKTNIVNIVGKTLSADRCFISDYDKEKDAFLPVKDEYLSSKDIVGYKGFNSNIEVPNFAKLLKHGQTLVVNNQEIFLNNEKQDFEIEKAAIKKFGVHSAFAVPLFYQDILLGTLSCHYTREHFIDDKEISLVKIIANQVAIAIYQARLFKTTKEQGKREALVRNVTEAIRNSLDVNETQKKIVENIGKTLNADRCFILEYNQKLDNFFLVNEEYLSSGAIRSYKGVDLNEHIPNFIAKFKEGKRLIINENRFLFDEESYDVNNEKFAKERNAIEEYKVYSALVFPIFYKNEFLGDLVLHYVDRHHDIQDDEIIFLKLIANQIGIAIHQAKLYEKIQLQSERERISRNIIEIMRSTLDKAIIKHLFVKNIGKYFNADRVYFSEFSQKLNKYMPVDEKSEYLSNPKEKSFVKCDISGPIMQGYIQGLLENRERLIPNWKDYLEKNPQTPEFIEFFKQSNVKSSYSFPVLYEGARMGYFCIAFTSKVCELSNEDIKRIRSICSQAGIALYHAELYMKAQEALQVKSKIISRVKAELKEPVDNIIKVSKTLSEFELAREKQLEYLNNIINSCNELMELTKNILDL